MSNDTSILTSTNYQIVEVRMFCDQIASRHETGEDMSEKKTVLLVDDEADIRELYKLVLEAAGYAVIVVSGAQAALDILAAHPVDLLITDYQMPEMSGRELIAALREAYPRLPTILASGQTNVKALAQACGASAYYPKSTTTRQLVDLVTQQLCAVS